jgi:hypothetical protein
MFKRIAKEIANVILPILLEEFRRLVTILLDNKIDRIYSNEYKLRIIELRHRMKQDHEHYLDNGDDHEAQILEEYILYLDKIIDNAETFSKL